MWESRALRLLTIFFCGPTIVTPTFFRSLRGRREEWERTKMEGKMGRKKDVGECALVLADVTPM